jgi:hypothetical protein
MCGDLPRGPLTLWLPRTEAKVDIVARVGATVPVLPRAPSQEITALIGLFLRGKEISKDVDGIKTSSADPYLGIVE